MDCCVTAILPSAIFKFSHDIRPFQRGFYCDDDSIKYPYKDNTVPWWAVGVVGIVVPVLTVSCFSYLDNIIHICLYSITVIIKSYYYN